MDPGSPSYGTSDGSCGYGDLSKTAYPFWSVAALSTQNQFYLAGPANGCGECFEIQCLNSGGQFAGRCNSDPALTFNKIAPMLNGRIDIQYRRVECTPPVPVKVQIDGNSGTGGWLRLAVTTNGGSGGVKTVQVKGPNSGWQGLSNTFGAEWELPNQPSLPIDLHIISDSGQEITAYGVITTSGQTGTVSTNQQFAFSGIATNYGGPSQAMDPYTPSYGTSDGSCGYGVMDKTQYPYWSVAALSPSNPFYIAGPIAACGQCFEIQCLNSGGQFAGRCNSDPSQRSTTVMISDVCPECEADHLDIQALTYDKIAPMLSGRIDIQYRRVQCTPPSNLVVNIDQNSGTGGFLKMSVSTAGGSGGISSVQVKGPNTAWTGLHNLYGAEWELDTQPQLPLDIHIIADTGAEEVQAHQLVDHLR
ncbi:hypothetical protein WJX79_002021 [Trebouxia sp. C0005]